MQLNIPLFYSFLCENPWINGGDGYVLSKCTCNVNGRHNMLAFLFVWQIVKNKPHGRIEGVRPGTPIILVGCFSSSLADFYEQQRQSYHNH